MTAAIVLRGDARALSLPDESVDLIVTSPPYFALRSYRDGDEHYDGQIGSEPTPQDFLEALWACTTEWWRVLKPGASLWVNLGDKYAGSGGHNNSGIGAKSTLSGNGHKGGVGKAGPNKIKRTPRDGGGGDERRAAQRNASRRNSPDSYNKATIGGARAKSLMGLPWRYANGCVDGMAAPCVCGHSVVRHDRLRLGALTVTCRECDCAIVRRQGWILRAEVVWSKPNGLPESVTDRVRRSHEQWFHFTKEPRYFAAVDEVREPHASWTLKAYEYEQKNGGYNRKVNHDRKDGGDSSAFAVANPLGKVPGSVWTVALEPLRVPLFFVEDDRGWRMFGAPTASAKAECTVRAALWRLAEENFARGVGLRVGEVDHFAAFPTEWPRRIVLGWSLPGGIVLDPFGGTGTTAMVAKALGRIGISVDLSADYCRLARWRIDHSGHATKALKRTDAERQGSLL